MLELIQASLISHYGLLGVTTLLILFYGYMKFMVFKYWSRRKIPYGQPHIFFGNLSSVIYGQSSLGNAFKALYNEFKGHRYHGIFTLYSPKLMINDPGLIRQILIKEFNKFPDRGLYCNETIDPLSGHLFFLAGERWRHLRAKLSPTFTSGKLKVMFPLLKEVGEELVKAVDRTIKQDGDVIDVKDFVSRYTNDTIATIAFGFNCNSLEKPNHDFRKYGKKITDRNPIFLAVGFFAPVILNFMRLPLISVEVTKFFTETFRNILEHRQKHSIVRNDFMDLLNQLIQKGKLDDDNSTVSDSEKVTMMQATAQAFVFFAGGFETTSSTITYALYELARNPEIQERLQAEIDEEYESDTGITYEKLLKDMPYLQMVFAETVRMHPSVPFLNRVCVEDYEIPDSDVCIKKGTGVIVSVTGLHNDSRYFPEPERFDPERFTKEKIAQRNPHVYLPFGDGPRICIGLRFGIVQSKMALISLLYHYKFSICEKTALPMQYSKRALVQRPSGPVYLRFERRK